MFYVIFVFSVILLCVLLSLFSQAISLNGLLCLFHVLSTSMSPRSPSFSILSELWISFCSVISAGEIDCSKLIHINRTPLPRWFRPLAISASVSSGMNDSLLRSWRKGGRRDCARAINYCVRVQCVRCSHFRKTAARARNINSLWLENAKQANEAPTGPGIRDFDCSAVLCHCAPRTTDFSFVRVQIQNL